MRYPSNAGTWREARTWRSSQRSFSEDPMSDQLIGRSGVQESMKARMRAMRSGVAWEKVVSHSMTPGRTISTTFTVPSSIVIETRCSMS